MENALELPTNRRSKIDPLMTPSNRDSKLSSELKLGRKQSMKQNLMTPSASGMTGKRFFAEDSVTRMEEDEESGAP